MRMLLALLALTFATTAGAQGFGSSSMLPPMLLDICQGRVIETINCTRHDTVLFIIHVVVDTVEVVVEDDPGQSEFIPPPVDGWIDALNFGNSGSLYALTVTDAFGNSAPWGEVASTESGTLIYQEPPEPWAIEADLIPE